MKAERNFRELFTKLKCCVVVPTYNNSSTLKKIIEKILQYTDNLIIVNDGSTDDTFSVLNEFDKIDIISYNENRGKGYALRLAFNKALEMGYEYAVTLDSDGQHDPDDLPLFLEKIEAEPGILIIGVRNMGQEGIPRKSSVGLKISNFWFWVETTKKISDSQSGYRCYPLKKLQKLSFLTNRFEFEIEVLVRASWKNIRIIQVPVKVHYDEKDIRISHFRPFTDFLRISILNSILVLLALLYFLPLKFYRGFTRENIRGFIYNNILYSKESNLKITLSVMLGVFMSIVPIWGWQLLTALTLAYLFKLNKIIVAAASNLSIPPMIPVILYVSYLTGSMVLGNQHIPVKFDSSINIDFFKTNLIQYIVGSIVFAIIASILSGIITYFMLKIFRKNPAVS